MGIAEYEVPVEDVENVEITDALPGGAIFICRLFDGSLANIAFNAQALASLEVILYEVQKKMVVDYGIQ